MPPVTTTVAGGMLRTGTPIQDFRREWGLWVKREDLACPPPGPPFSKTRGVYARVRSRPEKIIGVLDTFHSQAGHAVARACQVLGKECWNFYPHYKADEGRPLRSPQEKSGGLGAVLKPLPAGRSCILFHAARKATEAVGGYMMPNALKLDESVAETAKEVPPDGPTRFRVVLVPCSSGTIAAGVVKGFCAAARKLGGDVRPPRFVLHMGYSRSEDELLRYVAAASGETDADLVVVNDGYAYKDVSRPGPTPSWACNPYYDLKAVRWWAAVGRHKYEEALLWNVG